MANLIPSKKKAVSAVEGIVRTGVGFAGIGLGAAMGAGAGPVGSAIGGLAGAGITNAVIVKGDTEKKIVWAIGILNAIDVMLESAMGGGRGVIG